MHNKNGYPQSKNINFWTLVKFIFIFYLRSQVTIRAKDLGVSNKFFRLKKFDGPSKIGYFYRKILIK